MLRYAESDGISSNLDPISDILVLLEYLACEEYLLDLLQTRCGLNRLQARARAYELIPHVEMSVAFLRQALASSTEISFLPAYYGLLNLAKVCVLFGPRHADLAAHRYHGISYPVNSKDSRSVLSERLEFQARGVLPLYYETLTGVPFPNRRDITMADVYPYVNGVGAEYSLATGHENRIHRFRVRTAPSAGAAKRDRLVVVLDRQSGDTGVYLPKQFKALVGFTADLKNRDRFLGRQVPKPVQAASREVRGQFRPFLIYDSREKDTSFTTPECSAQLLMPEELPIFLLFFHMSSVVRYKPQFLYRVTKSRYWPMLAAASRHCLLDAMRLSWSFVHKKNLFITHGTA